MAQLTHEELANLAAAGVETPTENPPSATKVKTEETDSPQAGNEDTSGDKSQGSTGQDEPQEQATGDSEAEAEESIQTQKRRTFMPALKLGVAGAGLLPIFLILWGILTDGTSPQVAQKASESNQKQLGSKVGEEKGQLKTELAVKDQQRALKKLEQSKQQEQKKPKQAEKQQPQQASQPAQPASPEPAQPVAASPSPQPAQPASQPSPSPAPQPSPQPQQPQVASRPEPAPQPSAPAGSSEPEKDPMAQWKQAAQLGSYGESSAEAMETAASGSGAQVASASTGSTASAQPASTGSSDGWNIQGNATGSSSGGSSQLASASTGNSGGIGNYQPPNQSGATAQRRRQPQARPAVRRQQRQPQARPAGAFEGRQAQGDSMGGERVMVGATTRGELQIPLAWGKGGSPRKTVVRLDEPLEASNGEEALPAGALVVAEPQSSGSGLVQLSATKAIVERNGRQIQKNLPSGAIRVVSEGGEPLRADRRDPNTVGNDIASVLLGGVGKAAEALNQGNRSIRLSQGAAITENGDPNMWAGAAEGAAKSASELLKQRNQQSRQQQQQQAPVYAIDRGTDVQLIANQVVDI